MQAEESKDVGSRPKASSSKVTVLEKSFFIDNLASQIEKGNNTDKPGTDQDRSEAGTFGEKPIFVCSWRTWLRKMYSSNNDILVTCSCIPNKYYLRTAQAVIKHLERNHSHNGVVVLGKSKLSLM